MSKKNELTGVFILAKRELCRNLGKMLAVAGLVSLSSPVSQAAASPEYEAIYVSRDFNQQPAENIYSVHVPGDGNCFFWSILTKVMLHLQGQKNIGLQYALYTRKVGSWRVECMRRDLAETAWACAIWYGLSLKQNIALNDDERNRVEELVGRVFSSNGVANDAQFEYIEKLLCMLIDDMRLGKIRHNLASSGAVVTEKILWKQYEGTYGDPLQQKLTGNWQLPYKEVSCLTWDDVSGFFAMGEYFSLDMLPLMGGVDWIHQDGTREPLFNLGGIRVLSRRLDKHNHFVWGVVGEWNIRSDVPVFNVMFTGNHVQPLTVCSDVRTGYQGMGEPSINGRDQLRFGATLEAEWREDEGKEKSLTRARIQKLSNPNQRNRKASDPIFIN